MLVTGGRVVSPVLSNSPSSWYWDSGAGPTLGSSRNTGTVPGVPENLTYSKTSHGQSFKEKIRKRTMGRTKDMDMDTIGFPAFTVITLNTYFLQNLFNCNSTFG